MVVIRQELKSMILHELAYPADVQLSEARTLTYTYWSGSEDDDSRLR